MVFLCGVIQLAFLVSSCNRSNIDGHTIRLHITHYSATSFVGHLYAYDGVIFHGHVWYWVLEYDVSIVVVCGRQTNISFSFHSLEVIFYFHWWKRHITTLSFKTLLHENPDEFAVKVIVISWKFNSTGRLSLTKFNLWLWIDERKEILKIISIKNIFTGLITTPRYLWIVCLNSSFWNIDAQLVGSFWNLTFFVSSIS